MIETMPIASSTLPRSFVTKKQIILAKLAVPESEYDDLSPKGSVDEPIRDLIDEINALPKCVTTSSCSGRIAVHFEGTKSPATTVQSHVSHHEVGAGRSESSGGRVIGKGSGKWLYVSHDAVDVNDAVRENLSLFLGMVRGPESPPTPQRLSARDTRWIHYKFEPFILHVLTASLEEAQILLSAAEQAGFRESGAWGLTGHSNSKPEVTPMVAIRSTGLALESLVGYYDAKLRQGVCTVPNEQLQILLDISNQRFLENKKRIARFLCKLREFEGNAVSRQRGEHGGEWEDVDARRARKRSEGLQRADEKRRTLPGS